MGLDEAIEAVRAARERDEYEARERESARCEADRQTRAQQVEAERARRAGEHAVLTDFVERVRHTHRTERFKALSNREWGASAPQRRAAVSRRNPQRHIQRLIKQLERAAPVHDGWLILDVSYSVEVEMASNYQPYRRESRRRRVWVTTDAELIEASTDRESQFDSVPSIERLLATFLIQGRVLTTMP